MGGGALEDGETDPRTPDIAVTSGDGRPATPVRAGEFDVPSSSSLDPPEATEDDISPDSSLRTKSPT
jgi:hypothetical protein